MKASVIIPSYNAGERLYFNLLSLKCQDYPHDDFEVIVVDNGSTDNTAEILSSFHPDFRLISVRVDENRGIARGRNCGIQKASGDILIFHDSDMIATKDFISKHIESHKEKDVVTCGLPWLRIYTYYYSNFPQQDILKIAHSKERKGMGSEYLPMDKQPLISERQIIDGSFINQCFDLDTDFIASLKETILYYGLELKEYCLPWRFFITNNASVERKIVEELGMFDEKIVKYGFEDIDLGIRLYKSGCRIRLDYGIVSAHQEHLRNLSFDDIKENIHYICEKYHDIDCFSLILLCLCLIAPKGRQNIEINNIMLEVYQINSADQWKVILDFSLKLLQVFRKIHFGQCTENDFTPLDGIDLKRILLQSKVLHDIYGMQHFTEMLDVLIRRILLNRTQPNFALKS